MADAGRSVCVRGLPADVEPERLEDKLHIHFLRARNGGGEVTAVTINDQCATITFEDSLVALNVLSHSPHILEVDGKKYELSLSFPRQESSLLNNVILDMSLIIDCSQLPLGEETVKNICEKYPGLRVQFSQPQRHCTLHGSYSEVQAVVSHLVELFADFDSLESESSVLGRDIRGGTGSLKQQGDIRPADSPHRPHFGGLDSLYWEAKASEILLQNSGQQEKSMILSQEHSAEERRDWIKEADVEALSLIMEADVFAYLCSRSEQYKRILLSHGVHVVDVTSEGVTTLYLQSDTKVKTGSKAEKHMRKAHKELSHLYQQLEGNLRRAEIHRSALGLREGSTEAFKELQSLLPKVLLNYDQTHVYIVGESSEVSQAKQILLLGSGNGQWLSPTQKKENSLSSSLSNANYSTCESETTQKTEERGQCREVPSKSNTGERRWRGGEDYKLAARFRNSEIGIPGLYLGEGGRGREHQDLTTSMNMLRLAPSTEPTPPSRSSLATTDTVNVNKVQTSQTSALRVTGVNRRENVLFQNIDPLSFVNTFKTKGNVKFPTTFSATVKAPSSTSLNAQSGVDKHMLSTLGTTHTPKSSLKRANSFSGRPSHKEEAKMSGISAASSLSTEPGKRPKSSSLNSGKPAGEATCSTFSKEVTVTTVMWNYIKEAHQSHLDDLISDLQVTEGVLDKDKVQVILKGSELSKVEECQRKLQKLIGMIASDFCVQELRLADLGATESSEVFKAWSSNIRSRFGKILLCSAKDTLLLIGPKPLCSQATKTLNEVFLQDVSNPVPHVNSFTHQGTIDQTEANTTADQTPFQSNGQVKSHQNNKETESLEGHCVNQALRQKDCQSESWNVSCIQSPKQKSAVKERPKNGAPGELETVKTGTFLNQSPELNEGLVGMREDFSSTLPLKQTKMQVCNKSCACGENGAHVALTSCGVFLCPHCLSLHSQCMVCYEEKAPKEKMKVHMLKEEQTPEELTGKEVGKQQKQAQGIQGTMTYVELPLSLPGYSRYTTAKITYCMPDGIQGEEHPNPGSPFQGGVFEAYLPLSPKGRSLLPCLEKAFKLGLTFRVCLNNILHSRRARIGWSRIPHKTKTEGGKSGNGYPDFTYLNDLSEALKAHGIGGLH